MFPHRPHSLAGCTCSICCRQCWDSTRTYIVHRRRCCCNKYSLRWLIRRGYRFWKQWDSTQLSIVHKECCCGSVDSLGGCWSRTCTCCQPGPSSMSSDRKYKQMNCCITDNPEYSSHISYRSVMLRSYPNKTCPNTTYTLRKSCKCNILWSFSDKCNIACQLTPGSIPPDSMCSWMSLQCLERTSNIRRSYFSREHTCYWHSRILLYTSGRMLHSRMYDNCSYTARRSNQSSKSTQSHIYCTKWQICTQCTQPDHCIPHMSSSSLPVQTRNCTMHTWPLEWQARSPSSMIYSWLWSCYRRSRRCCCLCWVQFPCRIPDNAFCCITCNDWT